MRVPTYKSGSQQTPEVGGQRFSVQASPGATSVAIDAATRFAGTATNIAVDYLDQVKTAKNNTEINRAQNDIDEDFANAMMKSMDQPLEKQEAFYQAERNKIVSSYRNAASNSFVRDRVANYLDSKSSQFSIAMRKQIDLGYADRGAAEIYRRIELLKNIAADTRNRPASVQANDELFGENSVFKQGVLGGFFTEVQALNLEMDTRREVARNSAFSQIQNMSISGARAYIKDIIDNPPPGLDREDARSLANSLESDLRERIAKANKATAAARADFFAVFEASDKKERQRIAKDASLAAGGDILALRRRFGEKGAALIEATRLFPASDYATIGQADEGISEVKGIMKENPSLAAEYLPTLKLLQAYKAEFIEKRHGEVTQENARNIAEVAMDDPGNLPAAVANAYKSDVNKDLKFKYQDVDNSVVIGVQSAVAQMEQDLASGVADPSALERVNALTSLLMEPIDGRAPLIEGDASYNSTARSQLTKLNSLTKDLNKEIKKSEKYDKAAGLMADGQFFGTNKSTLNLTETEQQRVTSEVMASVRETSSKNGDNPNVTLQKQLGLLEINNGLSWQGFRDQLSLGINSFRNVQDIASIDEEAANILAETFATIEQYPATFESNVSKKDQDYMREVLRRSQYEPLPEAIFNTNSALESNLQLSTSKKKVINAAEEIDGYDGAINKGAVDKMVEERAKQLYPLHGNEDLAYEQAVKDVEKQLLPVNGALIPRDRDTPINLQDMFNASLEKVKLNTEQGKEGSVIFNMDDIDTDEMIPVLTGDGQIRALTKAGLPLMVVVTDPETGDQRIQQFVMSYEEMENAFLDKQREERRVLEQERREETLIEYLDTLQQPQEIDEDLQDMGLLLLRKEAERLNIYGDDIGESTTSLRTRIQKFRSREQLEKIRDDAESERELERQKQSLIKQLDKSPAPEEYDEDLWDMGLAELRGEAQRLGIYGEGDFGKSATRLRLRIQQYRESGGGQ